MSSPSSGRDKVPLSVASATLSDAHDRLAVDGDRGLDVTIPVFRLATGGGVERYTTCVGVELVRRGHRVTFVAPRPPGGPPPGAAFVAVRSPRGEHTLVHLADVLTFGVRAARRTRRAARGGVVYRPVGAGLGRGVVTAHSCHAAWLRDRDRFLGRSARNPVDAVILVQERLTFRDPDVVLTTVSHACAADVAESYGVEIGAITVAPPAIDGAEFPTRTAEEQVEARASFGIPTDRLTIGAVANHAFARKRIDLLIAAAGRLGATLLVAGRPDVHGGRYEALAATAGADVRFLGPVRDVRRLYCALDAFALPSVHESYGMAAHEAMAVGVATVVSTACGVAQELTSGVEALLVAGDDLDELTAALEALRDDERRSGLEVGGAAWAHERSWSDVVDDLMPALVAGATAAQGGFSA